MAEHPSYRALAAAVLTRAALDAAGQLGAARATSQRDRKAIVACAKRFLRPGNAQLQLLCGAVDIDPDALLAAVRRNGPAFAREMRGTHQRGGR